MGSWAGPAGWGGASPAGFERAVSPHCAGSAGAGSPLSFFVFLLPFSPVVGRSWGTCPQPARGQSAAAPRRVIATQWWRVRCGREQAGGCGDSERAGTQRAVSREGSPCWQKKQCAKLHSKMPEKWKKLRKSVPATKVQCASRLARPRSVSTESFHGADFTGPWSRPDFTG